MRWWINFTASIRASVLNGSPTLLRYIFCSPSGISWRKQFKRICRITWNILDDRFSTPSKMMQHNSVDSCRPPLSQQPHHTTHRRNNHRSASHIQLDSPCIFSLPSRIDAPGSNNKPLISIIPQQRSQKSKSPEKLHKRGQASKRRHENIHDSKEVEARIRKRLPSRLRLQSL